MKILVIDTCHDGIPFALRAQEAGHTVRVFQSGEGARHQNLLLEGGDEVGGLDPLHQQLCLR